MLAAGSSECTACAEFLFGGGGICRCQRWQHRAPGRPRDFALVVARKKASPARPRAGETEASPYPSYNFHPCQHASHTLDVF